MFQNKIIAKITAKPNCDLNQLFESAPKTENDCQMLYEAFVYRDSYTRRKYNFQNLKSLSKQNLSNSDIKQHQKYQILNAIQMNRNTQILKQTKKRILQENTAAQKRRKIPKSDAKDSHYRKQLDMINRKYFKKYLAQQSGYNQRIEDLEYSRFEKLSEKEKVKILAEFQQQNMQAQDLERLKHLQQKNRNMKNIEIAKRIQEEFDSKYDQNQYQLRKSLKSKVQINNLCLVEPDKNIHKSVKPLLKRHFQVEKEECNLSEQISKPEYTPQVIQPILPNKYDINLISRVSISDKQTNFHNSIKKCDLFEIQYALQQDYSLILSRDEKGNTPLHLAVKTNDIDVCRLLIKYGVPRKVKNYFNKDEFATAKHFDNQGIMKLLQQTITN